MSTFVNELELSQVGFGPKPQRRKKKASKLLKSERRVAFLFILPPVISFCIFTVLPLLVALVLAFGDFNIHTFTYTPRGFVHFLDLLNPNSINGYNFLTSVLTTVCFIIEVPIAIFLGLLCATLANSKGCRKTNTLFRVLLYLPTVCSAVAANIIWRVIFLYGPTPNSQGVINSLFDIAIMWTKERVPLTIAVIIKNSINGMGSAMILYYASMCNISKEYYEAAEMDGANGLQRFVHITFPMLTPVTFYLLIMRMSGALQSYADSAVFANGEISTVVYFIRNYGIDKNNYGLASAAAILLGVVIMGITVVQFRLSNKWVLDL